MIKKSKIIILAIKPYQYKDFILKHKEYLKDKLVVSIAAGISFEFLKNALGHNNFIRVMPNTPALVGSGVTCICKNKNVTEDMFLSVIYVFSQMGRVEVIEDKFFDTIIPVTGSSPAYSFMFINSIIKYAQSKGMEYDKAKVLAAEAVIGSAKLLLSEDCDVDTLVDRVCSKGGSTIEGVKSLESNKFYEVMSEALNKCFDRAVEMNYENK